MRYDKTNYNRLYAGELEDWRIEDIIGVFEVVDE